MTSSHYEQDLDRNRANFVPLSPLSFLERSATVYPHKLAIVHGGVRITYREMRARCRRLASALMRRGLGRGDTVSVMAPNVPALLEAHYGVPLCGAVLTDQRKDEGRIHPAQAHMGARRSRHAPGVGPAIAVEHGQRPQIDGALGDAEGEQLPDGVQVGAPVVIGDSLWISRGAGGVVQ